MTLIGVGGSALKSTTAIVLGFAMAVASSASAADRPQRNYFVYVCAESDDTVHKLRYGPGGFEEVKLISVGAFPVNTSCKLTCVSVYVKSSR